MRKGIKGLAAALLLTLLLPQTVFAAGAQTQSTSYTKTRTIDGEEAVSQDAYTVYGAYTDLGLNVPQDLYVGNGKLYIADTGNSRALVVDIESGGVKELGDGLMKEPRGIAADEDGRIYVADTGNSQVYRFTAEGELEFTFERPTEPFYGKKTSFKPIKVAPGDDGGVYLVCEGSTAGVVQINGYGNFLGYFASNNVDMSFWEKVVDAVLTEEQKARFLKKTPASYENVFRGSDKLIYTVNKGAGVKPKKHSISGLDLLASYTEIPVLNNAIDLHVTGDGRIYVLSDNGRVTEITADGFFLCSFGGKASGSGRAGLFDVPAGLGVDEDGKVYVLDREQNSITVFDRTPAQNNIYRAIDLYREGFYDESQEILDDVLKYNDASYLAHIYSAKNYMQKGEYQMALTHYRVAGNREGYSEAYWEIRNQWLSRNLVYLILGAAVLFVIIRICKLLDRKTGIFAPLHRLKAAVVRNRFLADLGKMTYVMRHPIDGAYYIKRREMGNVVSATVIYACLLIILILYQTATGFLFAQPLEDYSVFNVFLAFVFLLVLFISVHYLISSINDGLGTPRGIYVTFAYDCAPLVLIMPFLIIVANFATINDAFFINFAIGCLFLWVICNMVTGFIELHDYRFRDLVKNLLVTAFTMGVVILAMSMVYLMAKQVVSFVREVIMEVSLRV